MTGKIRAKFHLGRIHDGAISEKDVVLPEAVVIDVGIIEGRGWAVLEANAAWCSGIYGCDPAEVLRVVERACA
jgi:hypothetical protein